MPAVEKFKRKSLNLSTALEEIYAFKTQNETDKILQILSTEFSEMLDIDFYGLLKIAPDDFIVNISSNNYNSSFLDLITKLIFEGADFFRKVNKVTEAKHFDRINLALLKYLSKTDKTYSLEREELIAGLEKSI